MKEYIAGARRLEDADPSLGKNESARLVATAVKRAMSFVIAALLDGEVIERVSMKTVETSLLLNFINCYVQLLRGTTAVDVRRCYAR
jgi:hypothetical protein